eukprot:6475081-Pyramimonas_sp.AAC.1
MVFGFKQNHSAEQICVGLELQRGVERRHDSPAFLVSADVRASFGDSSACGGGLFALLGVPA